MGEIVDLEKYRRRRRRKIHEAPGTSGRKAAAPRQTGHEHRKSAVDSGEGGQSGADGPTKVEREDHRAE